MQKIKLEKGAMFFQLQDRKVLHVVHERPQYHIQIYRCKGRPGTPPKESRFVSPATCLKGIVLYLIVRPEQVK